MTNNTAQPKIFGIGLNKTGTTTLGECGKILGLKCTSCDRSLLEDLIIRKDFTRIEETVKHNDLFEDWPWPLIYKYLDQRFVGSKFILTVRESESKWIESLKKHSMKTHPKRHCRGLAYGYNFPHNREKEHIEFYRKHNEDARNYFKGRKEDFIELCWERGDGFEKLSSFLGCHMPEAPFPHMNKCKENHVNVKRILTNKLLSIHEYLGSYLNVNRQRD